MKKLIALLLVISALFTGCTRSVYILRQLDVNVESIEIGITKFGMDSFESKKVLNDEEMAEFFEGLSELMFKRYLFGDPSDVGGLTVKITYSDGAYELICYYTSQYKKDDRMSYGWQFCEEEEFNALIGKFYDYEADID